MPSSKGWRDPSRERSSEPRSLGEVVGGVLGERSFARGMPLGRLARNWAGVVGDRLAPETKPVRFEAGVLTVAASSGPWGAQARFLAEEIRKRANEALREGLVKRVNVVVSEGGSDRSKGL
jgi:predicted nucleic acid-binding Zn ribbon protein